MEVDRPDQQPAAADRGWWWPAVVAVLRRPSLWAVALGQVRRTAVPGWWRRSPFLPLPDPDYLAFRFETMYGSERTPEPDDVVTYLRWCREYRHLA